MFNRGRLTSVDDYLKAVPEDVRAALNRLRRTIKAAAPKATEGISYMIPLFKYQGHPLVGFGCAKSHCSFYVMSSNMIPTLARMRAAELKAYNVSGATIHFTPDRPLPVALVKKLVKTRIEETVAKYGKNRE